MSNPETVEIEATRRKRKAKVALVEAISAPVVEVGTTKTRRTMSKTNSLFGSPVAPVTYDVIKSSSFSSDGRAETRNSARSQGKKKGRRKVNEPSRRQENILNFVKKFMYENNMLPPTVREIQVALRITSTSVVDYNLKGLEEKGYLVRKGGKDKERSIARGIQLTDMGWDYETEFKPEKGRSASPRLQLLQAVSVNVPLLGTIAAGQPIPNRADPDPENTIEVPPSMLGRSPSDVYALRVKGQSMIDAFIADGDIVLIKSQKEAKVGETVAVWLEREQETTLKMWYPDPARNEVQLKPANETMKPIVTELSNARVMGKLVGVIRSMA